VASRIDLDLDRPVSILRAWPSLVKPISAAIMARDKATDDATLAKTALENAIAAI
jgi:hypothetical protein